MVGAARAIRGAAEGKDYCADRAASGAKDRVIRRDHAIGVVEQILGILQARLAERRIYVYRNAAARTGSHELRSAFVTGPCRRGRTANINWFLPAARGLDAVIWTHKKNLHFGQIYSEESKRRVAAPSFGQRWDRSFLQLHWNGKSDDFTVAEREQSVTESESDTEGHGV